MRSFEFALLDWIQGNLRNPVMDLLMPAVTTLGNGGLIWIALAGILLLIPRYRKAGAAVLAGLALEVICCNLVLKPLIAETAAKACDARSPLDVQTGPAVRNDFATKARHGDLLAFDLRLKNIYSTISQSIWETSKKI